MQIYDNVFDMSLMVDLHQNNTQVYNNLFLNVTGTDGFSIFSPATLFVMAQPTFAAGSILNLSIWNNVAFAPTTVPTGSYYPTGQLSPIAYYNGDFVPLSNPSAPISYMDYNVYTGRRTMSRGTYPTPNQLLTKFTTRTIPSTRR